MRDIRWAKIKQQAIAGALAGLGLSALIAGVKLIIMNLAS